MGKAVPTAQTSQLHHQHQHRRLTPNRPALKSIKTTTPSKPTSQSPNLKLPNSLPPTSQSPNLKLPNSLPQVDHFSLKEGKDMDIEEEEEETNNDEKEVTVPLSEVVADCVKRWFNDTLKEAKAGDVNMQVLLGQMYFNGYGITRDAHKGRIWMTRASRVRSSVWKVSNKRPGYNASDSDSDELIVES